MTIDGLAGEALVTRSPGSTGSSRPVDRLRAGVPSSDHVLAACDRLLGEIGRRRHIFGWLRAPGAAADEWLAVDAYYPRNRVVVLCEEPSAPDDGPYSELVPAHGLRLLRVKPRELVHDPAGWSAALERLIGELGPIAPPVWQEPVEHEPRPNGLAVALVTMTRPQQRERAQRKRPAPPERAELFLAEGVLLGLVLVAVLLAEIYLGFTEVALGTGHVLLAIGIAFDACARVLGTVGAQRAKQHDWVWPCALVGSPVVAKFALFQRSGPVKTDPAPLAGIQAIVSLALIVGALVTGALGI